MKEVYYQKVVELLIYTMVATKPNFAFAVNIINRFMSNGGIVHGHEPMYEGGHLAWGINGKYRLPTRRDYNHHVQ